MKDDPDIIRWSTLKKIPQIILDQVIACCGYGFLAVLAIGLLLELFGIDLLGGTTIHTHFWEYFATLFGLGFPIHNWWRIKIIFS
jgi:hypothetical protein